MPSYVALLRAVNVGGTGKLPMADLRTLATAAGFRAVRTYIASGNLIFQDDRDEAVVRAALEERLRAYAAKPVDVMVRTAAEMDDVLARNPFSDAPGNRVVAIFLSESPQPDAMDTVTGMAADEKVRLGTAVIYVRYGAGMASSKLRIPAAKAGTARNMNTVAKLAAMAAEG